MELAEQIEGNNPMSLDTKTGLVMHIACAVNPDCGKGVPWRIRAPRGNCAELSDRVYRDLRKHGAGRAEIPHVFPTTRWRTSFPY